MKPSSYRKLALILFASYFIVLVWAVLFKLQLSFNDLPDLRSINLQPFGDSSFKKGKFNTPEVVGNFLIFFPFGIYLNMFPRRSSYLKQLLLMGIVSLTFEVLQYIFSIGVSDMTDLLMNISGGGAGILAYMGMLKIAKKRRKLNKYLTILAGVGTALAVPLIIIIFVL